MRKSYLLWLLLLAAWIWLAVTLWQKYLCNCWGDEATKTSQGSYLGSWVVQDNNDFSSTCHDYFRFMRSAPTHLQPLTNNIEHCLVETVNYLNENPNKSLTITGYYDGSEKNTSLFPNLGMGRANEVKSFLVSLGLHPDHLALASKQIPKDAAWFSNDTLQRGIDFSFENVKANADDSRISDIKNRLINKPITLYFGIDQNKIELSEQQRTDFADVIYYLDHVPNSSLNIGGHTDNLGKPFTNNLLSQKRAEFVSQYLKENASIEANRLTAKGFGSSKPLNGNVTKEDKALNRRVEIVLN